MFSVLTVNFWSAREVRGLADSLRRYCQDSRHPTSDIRHPTSKIELVVTNNSPAEPLDLESDDRLTIKIINADNVGFGCGVNLAYRQAQGDLLMLANPDVRVTEHTLPRAEAYLARHDDAGIVLPLLRYPDGQVQPSIRRFYTWPVVLYARSPLRALISPPSFWKHYLCADMDRHATADVDWGLGAVMFLRRADIEPGRIFDDRFFMYFEDVDLCYRTWQSGRRVVYCPDIECLHGHHRHSANPFSSAGLYHLRSLTSFLFKYRGLPSRPAPPRLEIPRRIPSRFQEEGRDAGYTPPLAASRRAAPSEVAAASQSHDGSSAFPHPALQSAIAERFPRHPDQPASAEEPATTADGPPPAKVPTEFRPH